MRWLVCAGVWLASGAFALLVAAETTIGPTVLRLSQNHGVHLGDVVVTASAVLVSLTATALALLWPTFTSRAPALSPAPARDRSSAPNR